MERWRARLNMAADAPEPEQQGGGEPEAAVEPEEQQQQGAEEEASGGEFRFLGQHEQQQAGDTQVLAPATEEQAAAQQQTQTDVQEDAAGGGGETAAVEAEEESEAMDVEEQQQAGPEQQQLVSGTANWGAGGDRKAGLETGGDAGEEQREQEEEAAVGEGSDQDEGQQGEEETQQAAALADESYVAARLQQASLEDSPHAEEVRVAVATAIHCECAADGVFPSDPGCVFLDRPSLDCIVAMHIPPAWGSAGYLRNAYFAQYSHSPHSQCCVPRLVQWALGGLSDEAAAALREQLDARLRAASEGTAPLPDAEAEAHGREVWARCEALTAGNIVTMLPVCAAYDEEYGMCQQGRDKGGHARGKGGLTQDG